MRKPIRHDIKDPSEVLLITCDFTDYLTTGETISNQTWTSTVKTGTDIHASDMVTGTPAVSGSRCSLLVQKGENGVDYIVSCLATTSTGQKLKLSYLLPVRTQELL